MRNDPWNMWRLFPKKKITKRLLVYLVTIKIFIFISYNAKANLNNECKKLVGKLWCIYVMGMCCFYSTTISNPTNMYWYKMLFKSLLPPSYFWTDLSSQMKFLVQTLKDTNVSTTNNLCSYQFYLALGFFVGE